MESAFFKEKPSLRHSKEIFYTYLRVENRIAADRLKSFSASVFRACGCTEEDAHLASEVLVSADLRGVDSHGVARLSGYVRLYELGRMNPTPKAEVVHEAPGTAVIDGDAGVGLVIAPKAMRLAIEKAMHCGSGWVAVRNSNHFGIAGYHAMLALKHDMVGLAFTNASPVVAPTYAAEGLLGTNPIAVAIPADKEPPFVADLATTTVANGKLEILQRKNMQAPDGWVQDKDGNPTNDPAVLKSGGTLLPLGSDPEHSSYKGYALGSVVDIFSAIFSGANYGPWVPPFVAYLEPRTDLVGKGIGHFFGAFRIDAFRPAGEFKSNMDTWIRRFRNARRANENQPVLIPGDPERAFEQERTQSGIPLNPKVVADLEAVGKKFGIVL